MKLTRLILMMTVFALPTGISRCVYGATLLPDCYPGEPTATQPITVQNNAGCGVVWYCDVGHKWWQWHFKGNWAECKAFAAAANFTGLMTLTHAAKDAMWATIPADTGQDAAVMPAIDSAPVPANPPPSGLVTIDISAYKQSQQVNGFVMKKYGTVALGIPCYTVAADGTFVYIKVGNYYLIDRALVKKTVIFDPSPTSAYAICQS